MIEVAAGGAQRELHDKAPLYARAGVDVYWVIDLDERCAVEHRAPDGKLFAQISTLGADDALHAEQLGLAPLALSELFGAACA